jgi:geranylgeranyl diphosphate synthase type II
LEESKKQAQLLVESACGELEPFGEQANPLVALAYFITSRNN